MNVTPLSGPPRATMRDVAALAGVSLKTVSRVVNDEPRVSADVRDRVIAAVARLNYRPNLAASNLRRTGARTGLIGALVQDISNSFSASVLRALEDTARRHHTAVLAASLDEGAEREQELVHDLVTRRVDGLVLMPATSRQEYLVGELRSGTSAVFVDRPPRGVDADSVIVDNHRGARLAVDHLLDLGHRRIGALFHLTGLHTSDRRRDGFIEAYAARGLQADPALLVASVESSQQATAVVHRLLDLADPPTALFAGRNLLAAGAVRALAERGLRSTVALVGFDDFPMADLLDPPLTVIRQDVWRIGQTVADLLFTRIAGDTAPPRHVVIEPTLVQRGSGEIPPPP
ncbi:MAG: LacI family DNA-binding transcriptional regulator [Dermatophilaceae bacterium]